MSFKLTEAQHRGNKLLAGPQRHTALVGGSRSGKTFLLVRAIVTRALRAEYSRHVILRFRENAVWRSIGMDTFPSVMRKCFSGVPYIRRGEGYYLLPNKAEIWLGGLDDQDRTERILGQEFVTLYLNECSQITYRAYMIGSTRLAQQVRDSQGKLLKQRAYFDLNPTGKGHWTNRLFGQLRDPVSLQPLANPGDYARMFMNPRDNQANLSKEYIESLAALPERQRRRFYEGVYVDESDGALWTYDTIERCRAPRPPDEVLQRVVVAVDASGASGREDLQANEIGIVVAALGQDGHGYVLADRSCRESPAVWGKIVAAAVEEFDADCVVAEKNYGGDMVRFVIKTAAPKVPVKMVIASRGKVVRAEPISALYGDEKTMPRVHHCERFPMLEEQLCGFTTMGYLGEESPDRADAAVWALTELMLKFQIPIMVGPVISSRQVVPFGTHEGYG
jgi:phage terminase large subunit-like protein